MGLSFSKYKINAKYAENINKDRTMLKIGNMGLSFCAVEENWIFWQFFAKRNMLVKGEEYFSQRAMSRDGPFR